MRRKAEADAIASEELVIQDDTDINMRMSMFSCVYGRCEKSREDTKKDDTNAGPHEIGVCRTICTNKAFVNRRGAGKSAN